MNRFTRICTLLPVLAVALAAAPALAATPALAGCPPQCALAASVVNAAGVPEAVAAAAGRLRFEGAGLAAASATAVRELAAEIRRMPPQATVTLKLAADSGLSGPAAASQTAARQRALAQALQQQGVDSGRVKLVAGP